MEQTPIIRRTLRSDALGKNIFPICNHMQLICLVPSELAQALADANAANRKTLLALGMFSHGGLTCSFAAANAFAWAPECHVRIM